MSQTESPPVQRTCVAWSQRRERDIALRVHYTVSEQDGCKIYAVCRVEES